MDPMGNGISMRMVASGNPKPLDTDCRTADNNDGNERSPSKMEPIYIYIWLVVDLPLKKTKVSWDYYSQYMDQKKMFQTTNKINIYTYDVYIGNTICKYLLMVIFPCFDVFFGTSMLNRSIPARNCWLIFPGLLAVKTTVKPLKQIIPCNE